MARTREIKKRVTAVRNIQRITKTMQMIATARFTAALQRAKATQPYSKSIRQLVAEVAAAAGEIDHPLLRSPNPPVGRERLLVISSDRGFAGPYNANVLRGAMAKYREMQERRIDSAVDASGKKALGFFKFQRVRLAERLNLGDKPSYDDIERIARRYIEEFEAGQVDAVHVVYTRFISNSRQVAEVMQLLPITGIDAKGDTRDIATVEAQYEFSPSAEELLGDLLPLTVKTALFQAFNESVVSEQIARMIAMKAATENAAELGKNLRRQYNRARQAQITTELMEVISGAAALE